MIRRLAALLPLLAVTGAPSRAPASATVLDVRKTGPEALSLAVERHVLPNGLVVLLAPDPTVSSVLVWSSFRAGTLHEPPGRSGLAHLVEHLLATGPTPDTDYYTLLTLRRARHFNAHTGFDRMSFEVVVPAEELPAALWSAADRLRSLPPLLDAAAVERSRRVIGQERASLLVDAPYGLAGEQLFRRLYPEPHPLHGGVLGAPAELGTAGLEDVRAFIAERLAPANGVLTVVGRFDPAAARDLVEREFGALAPGRRATHPVFAPATLTYQDRVAEPRSREPRVMMAWRLPEIGHDHAQALELGAQLLTFLTDGAWGMRIGASLHEYAGESLFSMSLTLPHDETMRAMHDDADGLLRMLTHKEMPIELVLAANLALDRMAMLGLDSLEGRAEALTRLELLTGGRQRLADWLGIHWELERAMVRDTARAYLKGARVVLHARPTRPKPARPEERD